MPFSNEVRASSCSGVARAGSANRSPTAMANENAFLVWSFESLSKME